MRIFELQSNQLTEEQLNEIVPALLMGGMAAWSAYDLWNKHSPAYKAAGGGQAGWDAIKGTLKNDLIGDAAVIGLLGGAGKVGSVAWKLGKRALDARKATNIARDQKTLRTVGQDLPIKNPLITAKSRATGAASTAAGTVASTQTNWDKWSGYD